MTRRPGALAALLIALTAAGCGAGQQRASPRPMTRIAVQSTAAIPPYLRARMRPIGRGVRFHPPLAGRPTGACLPSFRPRTEAHIELFGANRVVLLPGGIGTRAPRQFVDGQLTAAACFGDVVTLNDTGILYLRPGGDITLADLFGAWGQPLSGRRIASFTGSRPVLVYVNGRRVRADPRRLRIRPHAEIVVEVGPQVPPHVRFAYPPIPQVS